MLPKSITELIEEFSNLPGIGPKSAARIVLYLLNQQEYTSTELGRQLQILHGKIKKCKQCFHYTESDLCSICTDESRNQNQILVVESSLDVIAFQNTMYKGLYHVLGGLISPMQGIGPNEINLSELKERVVTYITNNETITKSDKGNQLELILGCSTSLEGEATSGYIEKFLTDLTEQKELTISKIARGLPSNTSIDVQDSQTLFSSLTNRK